MNIARISDSMTVLVDKAIAQFNKMNFADVRNFSAHTTHSIQIKNVCVNFTKLYQ
jgi:hypothetical protein